MKRGILTFLLVMVLLGIGFGAATIAFFSGQRRTELLISEIRSLPRKQVWVEKGWGYADLIEAAWKGTHSPTRYPRQLLYDEIRRMNNIPEGGMLQEGTIAFVPGPPTKH